MTRGEAFQDALDAVLAAADRRYAALLTEAANYEKLRQPNVVAIYEAEHLKPLRDAMALVRAETSNGLRLARKTGT